ncbi:MAG TPA: hypothetical protein VL197_05935 [Nitrospirota bacterium]|nr:hypothetical protein [Nitrospirota bacterium]
MLQKFIGQDSDKSSPGLIAEYKEFRKDKSPNTQRADVLALQKLLDFYGNRTMVGIKAKVLDEIRTHLFSLDAERSGKQVETNTVNKWIRHLRIALKARGYV